jgi:hypothetical protein
VLGLMQQRCCASCKQPICAADLAAFAEASGLLLDDTSFAQAIVQSLDWKPEVGPTPDAAVLRLLRDGGAATRGPPWRRAAFLLEGLARLELRKTLRFMGLDPAGGPGECRKRLMQAGVAQPLLDELSLSAAIAALLLRLRLHHLDALQPAELMTPLAGVGASSSQASAPRKLHTAEAVIAAATAPVAEPAVGSKRPTESAKRASKVCR